MLRERERDETRHSKKVRDAGVSDGQFGAQLGPALYIVLFTG